MPAEHVDSALVTLNRQWRKEHPNAVIYHRGDKNHRPPSDHLPEEDGSIDASDVMPGPNVSDEDLDELAESLRRSRDYRIAYVIRRQRIFSSRVVDGVPAWTWRKYKGKYHGHTHISRNDKNESDNSEWELDIFTMALSANDANQIRTIIREELLNLKIEVDPYVADNNPKKLPKQPWWKSLGYQDSYTKESLSILRQLRDKLS